MTPIRALSVVLLLAGSAFAVVNAPWSAVRVEAADRAAAEKDGEELMARIVATEARAKQGPWIHAEEPVFDWGTVEEGTEIRHTFLLTNRGTELVTIDKARTNCGCGAFDFSREIPPGGEGHLTIVIPGNKVVAGKLRASITLRTNARGDDVLVATGRVSGRVAEGR
jgi:hypothetical protein